MTLIDGWLEVEVLRYFSFGKWYFNSLVLTPIVLPDVDV